MTSKFIEIGPGQDLPATIKKADQADDLFIGGQGELMQYSVSQKKVTKEYANITVRNIYSMVYTSDKNYFLF